MSRRLVWTRIPVDPEPLGGCSHPFKGLILEALEVTGSHPFGVSENDLANSLVTVTKDSPFATWLRGARATLPQHIPNATLAPSEVWRADLRDEITEFLDQLDQLGELRLTMSCD